MHFLGGPDLGAADSPEVVCGARAFSSQPQASVVLADRKRKAGERMTTERMIQPADSATSRSTGVRTAQCCGGGGIARLLAGTNTEEMGEI